MTAHFQALHTETPAYIQRPSLRTYGLRAGACSRLINRLESQVVKNTWVTLAVPFEVSHSVSLQFGRALAAVENACSELEAPSTVVSTLASENSVRNS